MPEVVGQIVGVTQHPAKSGVRFRVEVLEADAVCVYSWFSREGSRLSPGKSYRIQYTEKLSLNGGPPFRNITSAEPMEEPGPPANESLGRAWEPPPGFRKPRPNPTACVMVSAKQWNLDNPDSPVTQRMLCEVLKADSARQGLSRLRPEEALKLAGLIARGELAGQGKRLVMNAKEGDE